MYYPCPNCKYQIECKARTSNVMYSAVCPVCGEASWYMVTFAAGHHAIPVIVDRREHPPRVFQDAFADGELEP